MIGIQIFSSMKDAQQAGFEVLSPYPDGEGFLMAQMRATGLWMLGLVRNEQSA